MKHNLLNFSLLILVYVIVLTSCKQKKRPEENSYSDSTQTALRSDFKIDSEARLNELYEFVGDCGGKEKEVKAKFLEWMELYYPDWPVKGNIKVFEAAQDQPQHPLLEEKCFYNVRFQTIDPHLKSLNNKEIIIVKFEWKGSRSREFSVKTVRGVLY